MALTTKPFAQIVSDQAVTAQAASPARALDFSVGSTLRALAEGFASVALWLQGLVLRVMAATRASTSTGSDLDTWVADYGLTRLAAEPARGSVTFSRFTPTQQALIPVGALVKTIDGAWTYAVTDGGTGLNTVLGGYVVAANQTSITLPVAATVAGAGGNAAIGTVTLLASSIAGIDRVTNAAALVGGAEAETDSALRVRFRDYIASLPRAVTQAINFAVSQVQSGLSWSVLEGVLPDGSEQAATFTLVVDDGTGDPSDDLISRVAAAVEQYRPIGVSYAVIKPTVVTANVSLQITTALQTDHATAAGRVGIALTAYINDLPMGQPLSYTRLAQIAYDASPLVINVTGIQLNGDTDDVGGAPREAVRAGTIAVA